jgi:hypothetical protein
MTVRSGAGRGVFQLLQPLLIAGFIGGTAMVASGPAFAASDLDDSNINVDTDRDGVVTLRGSVSSDADRARAVDIARRTDGVRKVVDSLTVRAPVERR